MSEEMINLEAYDTLGIKMENPIQQKLQELPQPPFFMEPRKALPFWLVRSLQDKMPMVSIPEKIKVPYTRGLVGENLVQSLDPDEFVQLDPTRSPVEYAPLHDKNLKKFFQSPKIRKMVEKTGDIVNGRTACSLKEYNDYRGFVHRMLLNHVTQEQREEERLKAQELGIHNFLRAAKKDGKDRWNHKFKGWLRLKNLDATNQSVEAKRKRCLERIQRGEKAYERVKQMREKTQELRNAKWVAYKKRMDNYFKAIKDDQRRREIHARKRWMVEAVINQHRKSLNMAENKLKRELVLETNWHRRMVGQKLKLKKDKVVREQYHACIQLMKSRREKYYNRRDVEIDELLALPGMNSLDELEVFNTQFDKFSPEFVDALHGAKFYINRSAKSLTLDKSLRKYIHHHESATERMKKANVARPIKHALDLLIRRSVGYYAMVVMYKTIMEATPMALHLTDKIQSSAKLRELLLEEYKQFGPRSDTPFQTAKKFQEDGLSHCMCNYTLVDKDALEWPCPLCRGGKEISYVSKESTESSASSLVDQGDEVYVVGEGTTMVGFLVPPKITEGQPEAVLADTAVAVEQLTVEGHKRHTVDPPSGGMVPVTKDDEGPKEPDFISEMKAEAKPQPRLPSKKGSKSSKGSKTSKKGSKEELEKGSIRKPAKGSKSSEATVTSIYLLPGPVKKTSTGARKKKKAKIPKMEPRRDRHQANVLQKIKEARASRSRSRSRKSRESKKMDEKDEQIEAEPSRGTSKGELKESQGQKTTELQSVPSDPVEPLPKPPISEPETKGKKFSKKQSQPHDSEKGSKKNYPKKSILKRKQASKVPRTKGVSFAEQSELQKAADHRFPSLVTAKLVRASVSQQFPTATNQPSRTMKWDAKSLSSSHVHSHDDEEEFHSKSSIVSLLSITSDDRLHFVKGQCVRTKRGSKFGKIGTGVAMPQKQTGVKKGFLKGTCKCFIEMDDPSYASLVSNITERLDGSISRKKNKVNMYTRWKGVKVSDEHKESPVEREPVEQPYLATLLSTLPPKKQGKIRYLLGAQDLTVVCHCKKCHPNKSSSKTSLPEKPDDITERSPDAAEICKCRLRQTKKIGPYRQDRLAYIKKVIGDKHKLWRDSTASDTKSVRSRKISAKSMLERHKSMISRLWKKKSFADVKPGPISRMEPVVQKYYVDEVGNLYVLNRHGVRTNLKNVGRDFKIDEKGKKYFVDEHTGKKYLIDVTGRVYLENDNGDTLSLFYEDGKEYQDPEPKKLLLHDMVRDSVVDLMNSAPQESFFDNEDELVEMVYEYLFEGSEESVATERRLSEGKSDESLVESDPEAKPVKGLGQPSSKALVDSVVVGPRMPIKRPLSSLIKEVPFNRDISKLFLQRKKFHDCAAIVFRRTLLYSLASYTKIMEYGFDAMDQIGDKKKLTGLDCMVKGLTKITAHYPLKLIKSKRLAPYVDALVHGFLGSEGYRIFPGRAPVFRTLSTSDDSVPAKDSSQSEISKKPRKTRLSEIEDLEKMKQICLCGKENAAAFIEKNATTVPVSELMKTAACKKQP